MNGPPTVTVCISNYNGIGLIDGCIASVLAQDCGFPVEIVIHDDASTDGSTQHIRKRYPDVKLLESAENVGFCVANNRMAEVATGEYLLLLNNDAELYVDALSVLHKGAQDVLRPAILSLPQYNFDTGELLDIGSLVDPFLNSVPNRDPGRHEVAMVMGACLWIPKPLWQELRGFPEWFGSVGEDLYLCCRGRLAGYQVHALGNSGYRHRVGGSFGGGKVRQGRLSTTRRRRALSERNKSFVMVMCMPALLLVVLLPLHMLLLWAEGVALTLLKYDRALWNDIYAPLLPALWRERARLLAMRREIMGKRRGGLRGWLKVFSFMPYKLKMWFRHGLPEVR